MEKAYLLHLITPAKNASPFDVNMAYDAGWDSVTPYTHVELDEVADLTQDAIFFQRTQGCQTYRNVYRWPGDGAGDGYARSFPRSDGAAI